MTLLPARPPSRPPSRPPARRRGPAPAAIGAAALAALAVAAVANHRLARRAERANPPVGRFVEADGVRLHFVERGSGPVLVLLHGNGSMVQDFLSSGLVDLAARTHRVLAFDRPGYGHSERPRGTVWTPAAQADLLRDALGRLGVGRATVLGHSWGCLVAVEMARRHPDLVGGLVLASGYYYPTPRLDVPVVSIPAIPVLGDAVRHTAAPLVARAIWPLLMRKVFGPAPIPPKFARGFSREMAVRPSQLRAAAAESALMIPSAVALRGRYGELGLPVAIVAGEADREVSTEAQSARLHAALPGSSLHRVRGAGHMVHQTAPEAVLAAIQRVAA